MNLIKDIDNRTIKGYKENIYIAGFDVFYQDATARGLKFKNMCKEYGFNGLFPLDNEIKEVNKSTLAKKIFEGNIDYIKKSDFIIANLNNFRGNEPDSGTAFECGVGYILGKKIYGYVDNARSLKEKYKNKLQNNNMFYDENNMIIEDFDLSVNLMLSVPITIVQGNFEDCIQRLYEDYVFRKGDYISTPKGNRAIIKSKNESSIIVSEYSTENNNDNKKYDIKDVIYIGRVGGWW